MLDPRYYSSDDPKASRHELLSASSKALAPVSTAQASLVVTTLADVVDATDGQLVWKFSGAPSTQHAIGNLRLTSTWPARGGSCRTPPAAC